MSESDDSQNTRPISVAELLARNGTIGAPPAGGRRRRRRGNADAISVSELTGEIPVIRDEPAPESAPEVVAEEPEPVVEEVVEVEETSAETVVIYSDEPDAATTVVVDEEAAAEEAADEDVADGDVAVEEAVDEVDEDEYVADEDGAAEEVLEEVAVEEAAVQSGETEAAVAEAVLEEAEIPEAEIPAAESTEAESEAEEAEPEPFAEPPLSEEPLPSRESGPAPSEAPRPVRAMSGAEQMAPDPMDESVDLDALLAAQNEDDEELRSYMQASSGALFSGETIADDIARRGPVTEAISESIPDAPVATVEHVRSGGFRYAAAAVFQSVLAVLFGAGLFLGFDQLWRWNTIVALVLSVLVILGLVITVRVVRKTEDIASTLIAVAVGALVTLGPLALLQST